MKNLIALAFLSTLGHFASAQQVVSAGNHRHVITKSDSTFIMNRIKNGFGNASVKAVIKSKSSIYNNDTADFILALLATKPADTILIAKK